MVFSPQNLVLAVVRSSSQAGLANFNRLESHIILKELPEVCTCICIYWKAGNWIN